MGGPVHRVDAALKHTVGMLLRARGVTDYARLREKPLVVQIDTPPFCAGWGEGPFVYPRNYKGVLSRRWMRIFEHRGPRYHRPDARLLPNTRRRCSTFAVNYTAETSYPQGCDPRAVRHCKLTPGNNGKAPQLHTLFLHIAVDNCEQQVETFRRNL